MKSIRILLLLVVLSLIGCAPSPDRVTVKKGFMDARGSIIRKQESIDRISIVVSQLSESEKHDFWVGFSPTNQTDFAEITEDFIKTIGIDSTNYYPRDPDGTYFVGKGYSFLFGFLSNQNQLIAISTSLHAYPPNKGLAFVRFGSHKNKRFLTLPCSIEEFERVFGKADTITRWFSKQGDPTSFCRH